MSLPKKNAAAKAAPSRPLQPRLDKKRELATYRDLDLDRLHKSKIGRRKVQAGRLYVYLGDGHADRPYLKVLRTDYLQTWREVKLEWEKEAASLQLPYEAFDNLQRSRLENKVYDILAARAGKLAELEASFQKTHGRKMSPQERSIYAVAMKESAPQKKDPNAAARAGRRALLKDLLQKVEMKQRDEPGKLQQAWTTLVGPEMAMETVLESVDREKGVAVCRCLSSTRAYVLRRKKDLPAKLGELLGVKIEKLAFR